MDQLVSCYFCGDAVDARIEAYPLVTSDRVETGRDVVLCPSCRKKLTTVIEDVLDATVGGETSAGDLDGDSPETVEHSSDTTTAAESDSFDRSEYNRVVKLLQNRDFPVEFEEVTVVARSAYEIDRETTHAILDALVERDILEDRGDELVRA